MKIDKKKIKRILFITLSNIGDIVLTTPVLRVLSRNYPEAKLDVMVGPNGTELFRSHPAVFNVITYDKHIPMSAKRRLIRSLRSASYDLIVDMRNTLFPLMVGARYRTNPILLPPKSVKHKKGQHLWKLSTIGLNVEDADFYMHIPREDRGFINKILPNVDRGRPLIAISPGAKSNIKRWPKENFSLLADRLIKELNVQVIMVGDKTDSPLVKEIIAEKDVITDLSGRTSLCQLASVLSESDLLITNDSAPLHLAGAVDTKVLAIFGPTDPDAYGPTGKDDRIARKKIHCSPCGKAQCKFEHECMKYIEVEEVFNAAKEILGERFPR